MLSLNKDALAVVATELSSRNIGHLRSVNKRVHNDLSSAAKFAAISRRTNYASERCHQMVNELSNYAVELVAGFRGLDPKELQTYVDHKNKELTEALEQISSDAKNNQAEFANRINDLKAKLTEVNTVGNQLLKLEWQKEYTAQLDATRKEGMAFDARTEFAKNLIHAKRELLSLEHLAASLNGSNLGSQFSEVPYEKSLMQSFRSRVGSEVSECGVKTFDRVVDAAKVVLNNREYLVPFTSSPHTLAPYLHTLENNLVNEAQRKHLPAPPFWPADCFGGIVSWLRNL